MALFGLSASACATTHPSARATSTSAAATPASSQVAPASSSTTAGGGPSRCPASALAASVVGTEGAAGTFEVTVQLRDDSGATCALQGYPGAQLFDSSGTELPTDVVPGGSYSFTDFSPMPVTLAAGASAYFNMAYSDIPTGSSSCPTAASMWVTPPDDTDHDVLGQQFVVCDGGRLTVSPVFGQDSPETRTTAPPQP